MTEPSPVSGRPSNPALQLLMSAPVVLVTITTAALFALSWGAYTAFYREYDVSPRELGMDYVTVLTQQAFPVAILVVVLLLVASPLLVFIRRARRFRQYRMAQYEEVRHAQATSIAEDMRSHQALEAEVDRRVAEGLDARALRSGLVAVLLVAIWAILLFLQAYLASPGPYSPPLAVSPLQAQVVEVTPRWIATDGTIGEQLTLADILDDPPNGTPRFLFLGRTSDTVVLYEDATATVVRLPADMVALT
jgi:hypothetical protein